MYAIRSYYAFLLKRYTLKKPKPQKSVVLNKSTDVDRKVHPDEVIKSIPAKIV